MKDLTYSSCRYQKQPPIVPYIVHFMLDVKYMYIHVHVHVDADILNCVACGC